MMLIDLNNCIFSNVWLRRIDNDNKKQLIYLDNMFKRSDDEDIKYLSGVLDVIDDNCYVINNFDEEMIGYFAVSKPIINKFGKSVVMLYYGIDFDNRKKGYAKGLIKDISEYLLLYVDEIILEIDKSNIGSIKVAEAASFVKIFDDACDEEIIMSKVKVKKR